MNAEAREASRGEKFYQVITLIISLLIEITSHVRLIHMKILYLLNRGQRPHTKNFINISKVKNLSLFTGPDWLEFKVRESY